MTPNRLHETPTPVPDTKINKKPPPGDNQNSNPNLQQPPQPNNVTVGFFTGRAAFNIDENTVLNPDTLPAFDPRRPTTIPRSAGIDHSKSSPIPRKVVQPNPVPRPNFETPSASGMRQIGLPPGRSPYRPPSMAPPNLNSGVKRGPEQVDPSPQKCSTQPELAIHVLTDEQQ